MPIIPSIVSPYCGRSQSTHCKANNEDIIKGLKVSTHHNLTHSLFVDDVLFFGNGTLDEWTEYLAMISLFYKASSMEFSIHNFIRDGRENNCGYL